MSGTSILIAGVGGQGTLLASRIIGSVAIKKGYDVKVSEVHGMSQRGGSVVTYVKFSEKAVYSPIIGEGEADIVVAFELLEAYRSVPYLKKGGRLLINSQQINPMPVITGDAVYPQGLIQKLEGADIKMQVIDALPVAKEAGNAKAVNTVLIGLLAASLDIPCEDWEAALAENVPEKLMEINLKAFRAGYNINSL